MISTETIKKLPKTDLHVHLDGSVRLSTLIELAKEYNVELPSYTEEGLRELVFKDKYNSLEEYLKGFDYTCAVMQSEVALERVASEFAHDSQVAGQCAGIDGAFQRRLYAILNQNSHLSSIPRPGHRVQAQPLISSTSAG